MEEVAAEKVRAIMTRDKPRDMYDICILIKKGYNLHEFLVRKKLEKYAKFSMVLFEQAMDKKKDLWDSELKNLLYKQRANADFPKFEDAKTAILGFFKNNISLTVEFDPAKQGVQNNVGKMIMAERLAALNDNVEIAGTHIHPPFDARIIAFFYAKYRHAHLEIYESGNLLIELSDAITFPQSTESLDFNNIHVKKESDLYFQLFIKKEADNPRNIVYASIILKRQ